MSAQTSEHKTMNLKLIVWRQKGPNEPGRFETYVAKDITPHHSFLEMLDVVNEELIKEGKDPIAFDHDCREGICGMCSPSSTAFPTAGRSGPRSASSTCGSSRTATRSTSSRGGPAPSRSSGT